MSEAEAPAYAENTWRTVNEPNLLENIAPTRARVTLVLRKDPDHAIRQGRLRRL